MKIVLQSEEIKAAVATYVRTTLKGDNTVEVEVPDEAEISVNIKEAAEGNVVAKGTTTRKPRATKAKKAEVATTKVSESEKTEDDTTEESDEETTADIQAEMEAGNTGKKTFAFQRK